MECYLVYLASLQSEEVGSSLYHGKANLLTFFSVTRDISEKKWDLCCVITAGLWPTSLSLYFEVEKFWRNQEPSIHCQWVSALTHMLWVLFLGILFAVFRQMPTTARDVSLFGLQLLSEAWGTLKKSCTSLYQTSSVNSFPRWLKVKQRSHMGNDTPWLIHASFKVR